MIVEEAEIIYVDEARPFVSSVLLDLDGVDLSQPVAIDLVILVDPLEPADIPDRLDDLNEALPFYAFVSDLVFRPGFNVPRRSASLMIA